MAIAPESLANPVSVSSAIQSSAPAAPASAPAPPAQTADQETAQRWPSYTWALNIPELKAILSDPNISNPAEIQARIEGTNWWRNTAPAIRNWDARVAMDPEGAQQDTKRKAADVWDLYYGLGLQPSAEQSSQTASDALRLGWTDAQIKDSIVSHITYSPDMMQQAGGLQLSASQLKSSAADWGVSLTDETAFDFAKKIAAGEKTAQDYTPYFQGLAKGKYPTLAEQIDQGITVKQFATNYQQDAGKLLEVDPNTIDVFNDPKWSKALSTSDPKTGALRPMTFTEWDSYLRGTDQYKHDTHQGQAQAADMASGLLDFFGKTSGGGGLTANG